MKLLTKPNDYERYIKRKNDFLASLEDKSLYLDFKAYYIKGASNLTKMKARTPFITKNTFVALERKYKRERFYNELLGKELSFQEILNFYNYYLDNTQYITMHKTKGTGIENVIVVLDTYFWNKYNFKSVFDKDEKKQRLSTDTQVTLCGSFSHKKELDFCKIDT